MANDIDNVLSKVHPRETNNKQKNKRINESGASETNSAPLAPSNEKTTNE